MKKTDCNICENKNIPLNDTVKVDGKVYCNSCLETHFPDSANLDNKIVEKEADLTVCSFCQKDFGDIKLNTISLYPICNDCETDLKNKTFPAWVKTFFISILFIVIISFIWNWKYYQAYNNINKSYSYYNQGEFAKASMLMLDASKKVPEAEDIKILSHLFHGVELLTKDKNNEALLEFNKCKDKMPDDFYLKTLIIQAKIGSAFDNKDYIGFLEASKENLAIDTTVAVSLTSVASAYACLYAEKGFEELKQNALNYLGKAKAIDSTSKDMKEYYNMIEYRIDSRKIIRREDFVKQFPNGWIKN